MNNQTNWKKQSEEFQQILKGEKGTQEQTNTQGGGVKSIGNQLAQCQTCGRYFSSLILERHTSKCIQKGEA